MRFSHPRLPTPIATLAAGAMIAHQVGGKAMRDAFFLSNFDVTSVPTMIMVAAGVSIVFVLATSGVMSRLGPDRIVVAGFATSAVLHLAEWGLALSQPRITAVLVYLHSAVIGVVLISAFWGLITERFDPRTAKKRVGRIAAGATLGGILGGVLADRMGAAFAVTTMLPVLAVLHAVTALVMRLFVRATETGSRSKPAGSADPRHGLRALREVPYLRDLAGLVTLTTMAGVLVAYVFQVAAVDAHPDGPALLQFFALFYTAVNVVTFLVQTTLSRRLLERFGLARTVALQPVATVGATLAAMFVPGLRSTALAFGGITVLGNSTFRSAYEVHFSAITKNKKRATKAIVDVGFQRLGDVIGGGAVKIVLLLGLAAARTTLLGMAAALGLASLVVVRRLQKGYIKALEESLLHRAVDLELDDVMDSTTRVTVLKTMTGIKLDPSLISRGKETPEPAVEDDSSVAAPPSPAGSGVLLDPVVNAMLDLRSGDPVRIKRCLDQGVADPATIPTLIRLLAWDEVAEHVVRALIEVGPTITGQLGDALLDADEEFAIRRRVPRVLGRFPTARAARTVFEGLGDRRFEVRFQCGRALASMQSGKVSVPVSRDEIYGVVEREVKVERRVWEGRRLLERVDDSQDSVFVDEVLRDRANRSLEHVFTVLSLTLPREPLRVAFRGLHTTDRTLRGTALEYLESVLPPRIREGLWPFLEGEARPKDRSRTREEIIEELFKSSDSIQINLDRLKGEAETDG